MTWTSKRDVISTIQGSADQTIKIAPRCHPPRRHPKVSRSPTRRGTSYYVEYHTDSGLDHIATVNGWNPQLGVTVLREDAKADSDDRGSLLLDATPCPACARWTTPCRPGLRHIHDRI